ncbi:hypothetical protein EDD86DRAFT_206335, partial [Gorgonomyces haynaldii]
MQAVADCEIVKGIWPQLGTTVLLNQNNCCLTRQRGTIFVQCTDGRVTGISLTGLNGSVPKELGQLTQITSLVLNQGNLTGEIPPELGNLNQLQELDLSSNNLVKQIPSELGKLVKLINLNLTNNADLKGPLPSEWQQLKLETCSLGSLCSADGFKRPEVCGLTIPCPVGQVPLTPTDPSKQRDVPSAMFIGTISGAIIGAFALIFLAMYMCQKRMIPKEKIPDPSMIVRVEQDHKPRSSRGSRRIKRYLDEPHVPQEEPVQLTEPEFFVVVEPFEQKNQVKTGTMRSTITI